MSKARALDYQNLSVDLPTVFSSSTRPGGVKSGRETRWEDYRVFSPAWIVPRLLPGGRTALSRNDHLGPIFRPLQPCDKGIIAE
jgi:hypothetical protein